MKKLLQENKGECIDLTSRPAGLGKERGKSKGKEQEDTVKSNNEENKIISTESTSTEQGTGKTDGGKRYSCRYCHKDFDSPFGRSVHVRSHKRCKGCKKEFPFPSLLKSHKPTCAKFKKWLAKKAHSTDHSKPQSSERETIKEENLSFSSNQSESSKRREPTKMHSCIICNKIFRTPWSMEDHMRVHTSEKTFLCSMCPKKFQINKALKVHMTKIHKNHVNPSDINGGLSWTMPLEMTEDYQEDLVSPSSSPVMQPSTRESSDSSQQNPTIQSGSSPQRSPAVHLNRTRASRVHKMGTQCVQGFICSVCQTLTKNKLSLIEHYRIHTGEKPCKCDNCPAVFRTTGQLSLHRKKCLKSAFQCEKCKKMFCKLSLYEKHVSRHHIQPQV